MSRHKLFKPDTYSPLSLGMTEDMTLKKTDNQCSTLKTPKTPEQGLKRENLMITPVSKKMTRKKPDSEKKDSAESGNENHPALLSNSETPEPGSSKNINFKPESNKIPVVEKASPDSILSSVPDDDFENDDDFFSKLNQKLPYTYHEDEVIVRFVFKGQNIFRVSSLSLWRTLEGKKDNPKRTYQSLKNRFLRNIKPHLFTTYRHLIPDQSTVEKILIKFPELKRQMGARKFLSQIRIPELEKRAPEEDPALNLDSNECNINIERRQKERSPDEDVERSISPLSNSSKTHNFGRNLKFSENSIKITINSDKSKHLEVPFSSLFGLSERFKKLRKNNERVPCPTCGRFYRRPVSNDSSESDAESDILIPNSVETDKNPNMKNVCLISNKSPLDVSRKMSLRSRSSLNSSSNQNLLISLEKSDKSDENSEESNSVPEEVAEKDEVEEIIEVVEMPLKESVSDVEDKTMDNDNDSDIDLIYEHTVARFHKLIDANEEKTLQKKCLNKDRDSIGFNANADKNLDSFFLETTLEVETPALTNDYSTQVEVNSTRMQSQRITRSSVLASNMIKMFSKESKNLKKSQK